MDYWFSLCDKYEVEPVEYGHWIDCRVLQDRMLSTEEAVKRLEQDLRLAHRLGFKVLRTKMSVIDDALNPVENWREIIKGALPLAERLGLQMCPEIHIPTNLKSQMIQDYIDFIKETGTKSFGLNIDFSVFRHKFDEGEHVDPSFVPNEPEDIIPQTRTRTPQARAPIGRSQELLERQAQLRQTTPVQPQRQLPKRRLPQFPLPTGQPLWAGGQQSTNRQQHTTRKGHDKADIQSGDPQFPHAGQGQHGQRKGKPIHHARHRWAAQQLIPQREQRKRRQRQPIGLLAGQGPGCRQHPVPQTEPPQQNQRRPQRKRQTQRQTGAAPSLRLCCKDGGAHAPAGQSTGLPVQFPHRAGRIGVTF